ncbi:MAG: hypothetical protein FOGNACKC_02218 [Anaerolineae bacterium]|nr:hypothetical protein [Anaerolineae bacterium]
MIFDNIEGSDKTAVIRAWVEQWYMVDDLTNEITIDLERIKTNSVDLINRQAGEARTRIGTNIPFQGDVYQLKQQEAAAFAADAEPSAASYPVLYAEAQARSMEPAALAAEYSANAQAWPQIIAAIEAVRMASITSIKNATTITEIEAALVAINWSV